MTDLLHYSFQIKKEFLFVNGIDETGKVKNEVKFPLAYIFWGGRITIYIPVQEKNFNRFLWYHPMTSDEFKYTGEYAAKGEAPAVLCAYTNTSSKALYLYLFTTPEQIYKKFVHVSTKNAKVYFEKDRLLVELRIAVYSEKYTDLEISNVYLVINAQNKIPVNLKLQSNKGKKKPIKESISVKQLTEGESDINNSIHIEFEVNNVNIKYNIGRKRKKIKETKYYYIPQSRMYYDKYALFVRQNINANYVLVIREKDPIEEDAEFLELESDFNSALMYYRGKFERKHRKKNVNLYFEKNSAKADEGTWQLFQLACESENSENYFILDKRSSQWDTLSEYKNVIAKYSKRYYELLYSCDNFISTETSSHLNVHRAINPYVRKALLERPLIFLQHGVTYLKRQGNTSVFGKGKEGEPTYMAVGSEKEKNIVCKMLKLNKEQCMNTGLPVFSTIEYEHITEKSEDIVTIMLTWKPSEEYLLSHFEDSSYYKNTMEVYQILKNQISEDKICLLPHPKVLPLLLNTDLKERVNTKKVSEVIKQTKLLITDYSSICYNAFYQGAGVLFYQPDLEAYEKEIGKLIPKNEEYIGFRVFSPKYLTKHLKEGIYNEKINLSYFRTEEFKKRYSLINEYNDGKNVERIAAFLKDKGVI